MTTHRRLGAPGSVRPEITAEVMARTGIDEAVLELNMRSFHEPVLAGSPLRQDFAARIADWPAHLLRIASSCSSVAPTSGQFQDAAMARHLPLPIRQMHLDCWLRLFRQPAGKTCDSVGNPWLIERAERMAHAIMTGIRKARSHSARDSVHPVTQKETRDD